MSELDEIQFIRQYRFVEIPEDVSKAGRRLKTVRVGEVYVSHLTIEPGVVTGNLYHKDTNIILLVMSGRVQFTFVQVNTKERKEIYLRPGDSIVHVPPHTAIASKNVHFEPSVVLFFSNRPLRSGDDHQFEVVPATSL